jgi:hypothetical protein
MALDHTWLAEHAITPKYLEGITPIFSPVGPNIEFALDTKLKQISEESPTEQ